MSSRFALPLRSTLAAAAVFGLLLGRGVDARRLKQDSSEPPCPEVSLDNLSELADPAPTLTRLATWRADASAP